MKLISILKLVKSFKSCVLGFLNESLLLVYNFSVSAKCCFYNERLKLCLAHIISTQCLFEQAVALVEVSGSRALIVNGGFFFFFARISFPFGVFNH